MVPVLHRSGLHTTPIDTLDVLEIVPGRTP